MLLGMDAFICRRAATRNLLGIFFFPEFKNMMTDKKRFFLTIVLSLSYSELFKMDNYDVFIV
ncbi:hypothetical protein BDD30_3518 [Photorhabdus asymbiotica]|uniref:Uncharacterized protein n=1 Tax=Photorhabdus asymbiotica TaxID=291112 RepID=A0ABX9SJY3_9GAMM|nr:hypothetical protein BDD30_3518 [Photorhabdus asymbiotica]